MSQAVANISAASYINIYVNIGLSPCRCVDSSQRYPLLITVRQLLLNLLKCQAFSEPHSVVFDLSVMCVAQASLFSVPCLRTGFCYAFVADPANPKATFSCTDLNVCV